MKIFSYNQYIKCIHTLRLNAVLQLAEEGEEYQLEIEKQKNSHEELVKKILKDKKEVAIIINNFLNPQTKIKFNELIKYTNNYISKKYKSKEDLIYKIKNQEIFFLIEHQYTPIDNSIIFRMLNYCIDIIQEWSRTKKLWKNERYPIIIPIIIYTGNEKCKIPKNFKEKQISNYVFERYKIDFEYNIIDINKISKQTLLEQDTFFGYTMLIEKSKNKEELIDNLNLIIKTTEDKEKINQLIDIINYLLDDVLQEDIKEELVEKINKKEGKKDMSTLYDRLLEENRKILKKGETKSIKRIAKNMINKNLDDKTIIEITGIKKEDLQKIKNNSAITI